MVCSAPDTAFAWAPLSSMPADAPIYMGARYQTLLAAYDGAEARVVQCRVGQHTAWLPLLVRDLGGGMREAYSAYGYGGILGASAWSGHAVDELRRHLAREGITALFLRHSPFLCNQTALPEDLRKLNRYTYAVDLQPEASFDACLARLPQKLRWSANFAQRAGLRVVFHGLGARTEEKIRSFYAQYHALMAAKDTADYYLFSDQFFLDHARRLGNRCELAEVTDDQGRFLGGAFFLLDNSGWTHYHLSAAPREAMKLQAMELLILSALHRYANAGYRAMHLGGGHALDESDGLSRFKAKFASRKLEFHCSMLVCDDLAYQRERARVPLVQPGLFLIGDARGIMPAGLAAPEERPQ